MGQHPAIPLAVHRPGFVRAIHQAAIRRHPRILAVPDVAGFSIPHLLKPEVLRILQKANERFLVKRQGAKGGPVTVLHPPRSPCGSLHQSVPGGLVEHRHVLELGIGPIHPPRDVQQFQILHIPGSGEVATLKVLPRTRPALRCHRSNSRPCKGGNSRDANDFFHSLNSLSLPFPAGIHQNPSPAPPLRERPAARPVRRSPQTALPALRSSPRSSGTGRSPVP